MLRGLKMPHLLFADMIVFVTITIFFCLKTIYMMTYSIAHWDTSDGNFTLLYAKGSYY